MIWHASSSISIGDTIDHTSPHDDAVSAELSGHGSALTPHLCIQPRNHLLVRTRAGAGWTMRGWSGTTRRE